MSVIKDSQNFTGICEIFSHSIVFFSDLQLLACTLLVPKETEAQDQKRVKRFPFEVLLFII